MAIGSRLTQPASAREHGPHQRFGGRMTASPRRKLLRCDLCRPALDVCNLFAERQGAQRRGLLRPRAASG
jgi:hypothetical protein